MSEDQAAEPVVFSGEETPLTATEAVTQESGDDHTFPALKIPGEVTKEHYPSALFFLPSIAGFTIGLSNFVTFPLNFYKNGGPVYIFPYLVATVVFIVPTAYHEMIVGQFTQRSSMKALPLYAPIMKRLSYMGPIINVFYMLYSIVFASWALKFIAASDDWTTCANHSWTTPNCISYLDDMACQSRKNGTFYFQGRCVDATRQEFIVMGEPSLPASEYFRNAMVPNMENILDVRAFDWEGLGYMCAVVALNTAILCSPIWVYSVLMMFTLSWMTISSVILVAHLRNDLPNLSTKTLSPILIPKWGTLLDPKLYSVVLVHAVNSLGLGTGSISTLASYNRRKSRTLHYLFVAIVMDGIFGLFGCMMMERVVKILHRSSYQALNILDFEKDREIIFFGAIPQMIAYFGSNFHVKTYFFLILAVSLNQLVSGSIVTQRYIVDLLKSAPKGEKSGVGKRKVALISAPCYLLLSFLFLYQKDFIIDFIFSTSHILQMLFLAIQATLLVGCYGATQVRYDVDSLEIPESEFFWASPRKLKQFYENICLPVCFISTAMLLATIDVSEDKRKSGTRMPEQWRIVSFFLNPAILVPFLGAVFTLLNMGLENKQSSDLFKVQPGHPSWSRFQKDGASQIQLQLMNGTHEDYTPATKNEDAEKFGSLRERFGLPRISELL